MKSNIRQIMSAVNGSTFVGLNTTTPVKLTGGKKNPLQGRVTKVMRDANVMVFTNKNSNGYANMVERRLQSEGKNPKSFVLGDRPWGTRVEGLPIVEHNGKDYLEVIFLNSGKTEYLVDGKPFDGKIEGLQASPEVDQAGLNDKVIVRTFAVDNIDSIAINQCVFV